MPEPDPVSLVTHDRVRLDGALYRSGAPSAPSAGVVLVHGFTGSASADGIRAVASRLARRFHVLALTLRGHGRSGGLCTLGDREDADLDAAVAWLRSAGVARVATVGFSFGGAVVLRQAGLAAGTGRAPDAVVSVSAPSRWYIRDTPVMRQLHWAAETAAGRALLRAGRRARLSNGWAGVPTSPLELVDRIPPTPLLVVHGDADHFFPVEHAFALAAAAGGNGACEVWLERGFGHAEQAVSPQLTARVGDWLDVALSSGPCCM
jgi:pimeloyl-ACP methyl ester carboxylesterase